MRKWLASLTLLVTLTRCTEKPFTNDNQAYSRQTLVKWYQTPADSLLAPAVIQVNPSLLEKTQINTPKSVPTNLSFKSFKEVPAIPCPFEKLPICSVGQPHAIKNERGLDTVVIVRAPFHRKVSPAIVLAGMPETELAKDPAVKDKNQFSISYFGKLQGLRHGSIVSLLEDSLGNIWMATEGGGIIRFDGKSFTYYTEDEGLSNNIARCMTIDDRGNIWVGTDGGGLNKFDGKNFTHYTTKNGFPSDIILSLYKDRRGNIWAGTTDGACKINGDSIVCFNNETGLPSNRVRAIAEFKHHQLYFATDNGVSIYDGTDFHQLGQKQGLVQKSSYCFASAADEVMWIGTENGVVSYNGQVIRNYPAASGFSDLKINSLTLDHYNNLWISTHGDGAFKFNGSEIMHFSENEGLNADYVWKTLEDRHGNIWFGTFAKGVSKYNEHSFSHFTEREGFLATRVWSMVEDNNGNIWAGADGEGVLVYDGKSFAHIDSTQGLKSCYIWALYKDRKGNIWIGSESGVTRFDGKTFTHISTKNGLIFNSVRSIVEDHKGNMWFGTDEGLSCFTGSTLVNYGPKQGLSHKQLWVLDVDKDGRLWIGGDGGLDVFDGKCFRRLSKAEGLPNNKIRSLMVDSDNTVWVGTFGAGLCRLRNDSLATYTEKDGISNDYVLAIQEGSEKSLWIGTRFGITHIKHNKTKEATYTQTDGLQFKIFDYADGFLGIGVNAGGTIIQDKKGALWVAANDRVSVMRPYREKDPPAPNIQLTGIDLFNEPVNWQLFHHKNDTSITLNNGIVINGIQFQDLSSWYNIPQHLELAHKNNFVTFNFIGITTADPSKIRYIHKLDGLEDNWSAPSLKTEANYGNLPHGFYTFRVRAINASGKSSPDFSYTFIIRPPWWKTWAFRIIMVLLIIGTSMYYLRWRESKLRASKLRLEQIVKVRTAEVVHEKKIVEEQKHLIEEKHKEITDSINYAERIQRSFLASKNLLDEHLKDYFVFFQPKDVVSGDFFWASNLDNGNFAFVTADSTGHGVPGAIMSILNILSLELAIKEKLNEPAHIFNHARREIIQRLSKDGSADGGKDGMDAAIIVLNKERTKLTYSAANNPIWIARNGSIIELKPDKMPIGKHFKDNVPFEQKDFSLEKGDVIYALTDGMADQFGGPRGKKYMYKRLKELLSNIARMPMHMQHLKIKEDFEAWKGKISQVDDVTVIGMRI